MGLNTTVILSFKKKPTILTVTVQGNGIAQRERLRFQYIRYGLEFDWRQQIPQRGTIDKPELCSLEHQKHASS